jgi:hypothetical protein
MLESNTFIMHAITASFLLMGVILVAIRKLHPQNIPNPKVFYMPARVTAVWILFGYLYAYGIFPYFAFVGLTFTFLTCALVGMELYRSFYNELENIVKEKFLNK